MYKCIICNEKVDINRTQCYHTVVGSTTLVYHKNGKDINYIIFALFPNDYCIKLHLYQNNSIAISIRNNSDFDSFRLPHQSIIDINNIINLSLCKLKNYLNLIFINLNKNYVV